MADKNTSKWTAERIPPQHGRRVLITGATSGIGYETALELARHGAELILPARTAGKGAQLAESLRKAVPGVRIFGGVLDLASLASVRAFAADFAAKSRGPSLDLLINNAGVMGVPTRELTVDGYERQLATNFLGPFLLTALLYPQMKQVAGSRVVIVSSSAANFGKVDFGNLQGEKAYSPMWGAYAQSKLADSMFACELQRRVTAAGSPVLVTAAHPGYAITNLQSSGPGEGGGDFMQRFMMKVLKPIASQDAAHGALPTLFAAVAPEAVAGGYYGPDRMMQMKGHPVAVALPKGAKDGAAGARLWEVTEKLVGVRFGV